MKEQLSLHHRSIWKFKKPVMMSDSVTLTLENESQYQVSYWDCSPSFHFPELRTPGADGDKQGEAGQGEGKHDQKPTNPNHDNYVSDLWLRTPSLLVQSVECLFHITLYCLLRFRCLLIECHVLQTSPPLDVFAPHILSALPPQKCRCCGDASQIPHLYSVPQVMSHHWLSQHVLFFL